MTEKYCDGLFTEGFEGYYGFSSLDAAVSECNKISSCGCIGDVGDGAYYLEDTSATYDSSSECWVII